MAFSRTWLSAPAGWIIDNLNWLGYFKIIGIENVHNAEWVGFFILTSIFAIPSIILIYYIREN